MVVEKDKIIFDQKEELQAFGNLLQSSNEYYEFYQMIKKMSASTIEYCCVLGQESLEDSRERIRDEIIEHAGHLCYLVAKAPKNF